MNGKNLTGRQILFIGILVGVYIRDPPLPKTYNNQDATTGISFEIIKEEDRWFCRQSEQNYQKRMWGELKRTRLSGYRRYCVQISGRQSVGRRPFPQFTRRPIAAGRRGRR